MMKLPGSRNHPKGSGLSWPWRLENVAMLKTRKRYDLSRVPKKLAAIFLRFWFCNVPAIFLRDLQQNLRCALAI